MSASENGHTGGKVELFPQELKRRLDEVQQAYESAQRVRDAAPDLLDALKDLLASNDAVHLVLCDGPEVPGFDPTALGKAQLAVTAAEEVARAAISKAEGGAA